MPYKVTDDRIERVLRVLRDRGWLTQADVLAKLDAHPDWEAVRDIGPVLAPTMRHLMALPPAEFERLVQGAEADVEADVEAEVED